MNIISFTLCIININWSCVSTHPSTELTTIQISPQPSSSVRGSSALGSKAPTTTIASSPTAMGGPHVSTHPSTDLTVTTIQPSSETQPSSSLSGSDVLGSRAPTTTIASSPTASMGVSTHPSTYLTTIQPSPSESSSVRSSSALGRRALTTSSPTASMSGESSGSLPLPLLIGVIAVLLGAITLFFIFFITNTCRIHNRKGYYNTMKDTPIINWGSLTLAPPVELNVSFVYIVRPSVVLVPTCHA